ncbi:MAG TPA: NADH-quinone oxidoreductase subunit J, partial [Acidimicrobiales bacterium]|nr:NADH-quinone oxidoreductase subunit J [Acidimicrobiales bacterium]
MTIVAALTSASSSGAHLAHASAWTVFGVGAALILTGAFGVILTRNPVHAALMLVVTLLGVALEFIDQSADFLAAVQIIVYAGAVVILFLFVIMFLGVDR